MYFLAISRPCATSYNTPFTLKKNDIKNHFDNCHNSKNDPNTSFTDLHTECISISLRFPTFCEYISRIRRAVMGSVAVRKYWCCSMRNLRKIICTKESVLAFTWDVTFILNAITMDGKGGQSNYFLRLPRCCDQCCSWLDFNFIFWYLIMLMNIIYIIICSQYNLYCRIMFFWKFSLLY